MKKLVVVFLAALIMFSVVVGFPGQDEAMNSQYFKVMIGTKYSEQYQLVENKDTFSVGDAIYYSIKPVRELNNVDEIQIAVKTKDGKQEIQSEKFRLTKKKLTRPINPIVIIKEGSYVVEVSADNKILSRNYFNVEK